MKNNYVLKGTFIDTKIIGKLRVQEGYAVCKDGKFIGIFKDVPVEYNNYELIDYSKYLIIPGMSDLHLHAPQYAYTGTAMDVQLLEWLDKYTYKEESKFENIDFAKDRYKYFIDDLLKTETTRASIFATIHTDATLVLMKEMEKSGLKGYVGKLAMNRNCPDYYREESTKKAIKETNRWLDNCDFKNVKPILTPRFTPNVTYDYMQELGIVAHKKHIPMQSHLDENLEEIEWVKNLCPNAKHYSDTYDRYGLFGKDCDTIMAHCIYCNDEENELIKKNNVMIAHCPTSNTNVIAGIAPAAYYLRNGYRIGLGSDVAGGHTLSLLDVMVYAVQVSKMRTLFKENIEKPLTIVEAFYMATVGGGSFFGNVGLFEEGYDFDAVVINDLDKDNSMIFNINERFEKMVYSKKRSIIAKFVSGEKLF